MRAVRFTLRILMGIGGLALAECGLQLGRPFLIALGFGHVFVATVVMADRWAS